MNPRGLLKDITPPLLMKAYHKWRGQSLRFGGTPQGWNEAARMSSGYSESAILDRVRTATRAVVAGEAAYERDSVLFDKAAYPFALKIGRESSRETVCQYVTVRVVAASLKKKNKNE